MALREPVEREGGNALEKPLDHPRGDPLALHGSAQPGRDLCHPLLRAVETERAAQLLRLGAGEVGDHHRHLEDLLLKERHPERPREHRLQQRVNAIDRLAPGAAVEVRVHEVPLDRPRADDRHLDHHVVETRRAHPGERRHLRAALDLENADGIGLLHQREHGGVVPGERGDLHRLPPRAAKRQALLQGRHHPKPEEIDLDDAEVFAVVLVPLRHHAPRHGGVLQRHDRIELSLADNHPAGVLPEVSRQAVKLPVERGERPRAGVLRRQARLLQMRPEIERVRVVAACVKAGEAPDDVKREVERLADLAHRAPAPVADDVGRHCRTVASVTAVDLLDHHLALAAAREVEVDVGPSLAPFAQEPLEEQVVGDGIARRDPERVADRAVGRAAAPLHENLVGHAEVRDVPDDEKIPGETELFDQRQLALQLRPLPRP